MLSFATTRSAVRNGCKLEPVGHCASIGMTRTDAVLLCPDDGHRAAIGVYWVTRPYTVLLLGCIGSGDGHCAAIGVYRVTDTVLLLGCTG